MQMEQQAAHKTEPKSRARNWLHGVDKSSLKSEAPFRRETLCSLSFLSFLLFPSSRFKGLTRPAATFSFQLELVYGREHS
jgi:hypothetical protein